MRFFSITSLAILVFITLILHAPNSFAQNSPQDYVGAHNAARARVGVRPVTWNETVAAYARRYANTRIDNCELEHSMGPYGENIAEGYQVFSGKDAVNFWVSERPNYDHKSNSCVGDECLHYTQVVWRDSVHVGCARVMCKNGWLFITCNYDPPGNIVGQSPY